MGYFAQRWRFFATSVHTVCLGKNIPEYSNESDSGKSPFPEIHGLPLPRLAEKPQHRQWQ